jgi:hypothetical protein
MPILATKALDGGVVGRKFERELYYRQVGMNTQ